VKKKPNYRMLKIIFSYNNYGNSGGGDGCRVMIIIDNDEELTVVVN
jgi:hypothetical protein